MSARPSRGARAVTRRQACALAVAFLACAPALPGCVNQHPERVMNEDGTYDERIVATSAAVVEICGKLDLDLVGIPTTSSTLPERYAGVTEVGTAMSPDLETLRTLNPDYILSPNSLQSDLQPKYASIRTVSIFLDLQSVDGMYASVEYLGAKFGRSSEARSLVDQYDAFMTDYRARHDGSAHPKVLVLMGVPGSYVVATEKSYVGSLVALAGGENIYSDADENFVNANTEDMLSRDPDLILRTAHALPDQVMAMFDEEFRTNDIWKHFRAVREGRVHNLDSSLFGMSATFDYPQALEELEPLLYPGEANTEGAAS